MNAQTAGSWNQQMPCDGICSVQRTAVAAGLPVFVLQLQLALVAEVCAMLLSSSEHVQHS
jgi:hypothetical protein